MYQISCYLLSIQTAQCEWTRFFNGNDNVGGKGDLELVSEINR